jgi:hypothetical protein
MPTLTSAPALSPLRPRGLELTHVSIVPEKGDSGLYVVNRHFVVRGQRIPQVEAWEDRPLGEALEMVRTIMAMEGR